MKHTQTNVQAVNMNKFVSIISVDLPTAANRSIILILLVDSSIVDGNNGLKVYL